MWWYFVNTSAIVTFVFLKVSRTSMAVVAPSIFLVFLIMRLAGKPALGSCTFKSLVMKTSFTTLSCRVLKNCLLKQRSRK